MANSDEISWKRTKLSETLFSDKLKPTGSSNEDSLMRPRVDRKWTLPELIGLIENQGYTETDVLKFYQQRRHDKWMKLVSSDWFSVFLTYLDIEEILELDSAFCNHNDRIEWLNLLETLTPRIHVKNNEFVDKISDWLILKNVHPLELSLQYSSGSSFVISDYCAFKLTRNGSRLKTLEIVGDNQRPVMNKMVLPYVAVHCTQLENLNIRHIEIPDFGLEFLSSSCHQLKSIEFKSVTNHLGLDQIIKANVNLVSLNLALPSYMHSSILEILGLHCPSLQICRIDGIYNHATDIQIEHAIDMPVEIFTKGCPNLKDVKLDISSLKTFHKLLRSLGSHNPALEILYIWRDYDEKDDDDEEDDEDEDDNNNLSTREKSQSLQCLSNGCPLLKEIELCGYKLSTSDISYLLNHSIHLGALTWPYCNICDDGLIITKETDKLKYLNFLDLSDNPDITDESFINLIKGCHNLESIDICNCPKLTNISLFSIAANCPNLKVIYLSCDNASFDETGFNVLFKKCPKLAKIVGNVPEEIQNKLKRRQTSILHQS